MNSFIRQDLLGKKSDSGMRDSVVYVKQIQFFVFRYIHQFAGQRSVIGCIIKKRIFLCVDFMKKNIFLEMDQPDRSLIGDKMDLVSFIGQGESKLCSHYTRPAIGGVTNNTNTHIDLKIKLKFQFRSGFQTGRTIMSIQLLCF